MTCGELQSPVQDLSTNRCFVSYFEISTGFGAITRHSRDRPGFAAAAQHAYAGAAGSRGLRALGGGDRRQAGTPAVADGRAAGEAEEKGAEPADKPGSVVGSHSSRRRVTATLKQPTRRHRGPRHCLPIWSCSRWGLPCRSVARLAVRSYRTVSPLPRTLPPPFGGAVALGRTFVRQAPPQRQGRSAVCSLLHFPSARAAQALPGTVPCGARTFLGMLAHDAAAWPTPPGRILPSFPCGGAPYMLGMSRQFGSRCSSTRLTTASRGQGCTTHGE